MVTFSGAAIGHAAFLALLHVVFQLQPDRVAALVAERDHVLVEGSAVLAKNVAAVERVGAHGCSAIAAGRTQVVQPFEVAALAFPIADRVVDELQVADAAEVRNRKYRAENRLQADVLTLIRSWSICRNRSYDFFCTSIRFGIGSRS